MATNYDAWSKEDLIARLVELEASASGGPAVSTLSSRASPLEQPTASSSTLATPDASFSRSSSPGKPPVVVTRAIRKMLEAESRNELRKSTPFGDHPRRKIALKLSYLGSPYCGLTTQGNASTPLPTVEGVLQAALEKAELIEPGKGWDGCQFARCGRTDRGVSAAGQVVNFWIKSRVQYDPEIHEPRAEGQIFVGEPGYGGKEIPTPSGANDEGGDGSLTGNDDTDEAGLASGQSTPSWTSSRKTEYPYLNILNKILPHTIRLLAWAPLHPTSNFDARYSCTYRHYKYFFSLNATSSGPDANGRVLDIDKMREAASYLIGEHDFKNFCKIDGSKQITNFTRRIHSATISPVSPITAQPFVPSPYSAISPTHLDADPALLETQPPADIAPGQFLVFDLLGRAFLYHQVRHIMAILFLVGAGLEEPTIVKDLLKWDLKPTYEMADGEPLLLWDCGFPEGLLDWQYGVQAPGEREQADGGANDGRPEKKGEGDFGFGAPEGKDFILTYSNLSTAMLHVTHSSHLNTLLHAHFHSSLTRLHPTLLLEAPSTFARRRGPARADEPDLVKSPLGGNVFKTEGSRRYPKLEGRSRSESFEVANENYRVRMLKRFGEKGKPKKTPYPVIGGGGSGKSSGVSTPAVVEEVEGDE